VERSARGGGAAAATRGARGGGAGQGGEPLLGGRQSRGGNGEISKPWAGLAGVYPPRPKYLEEMAKRSRPVSCQVAVRDANTAPSDPYYLSPI
jgi:hypothetical protein